MLAFTRTRVFLCVLVVVTLADPGAAQQGQAAVPQANAPQLGGNYASLDAQRRALVDNWVARFSEATGQKVQAGPFYDDIVNVSAKTTFDAVTNALVRTTLTDASGASLGTTLDLVERVDSVRGKVEGAGGDHQFRMYVRLKQGAIDTLERSREFARGADNTVYHKGYPVNYRQQGGAPSIQISSALDGRRADIDVDYRASSFPGSMFNGHLTSANSDVRAGDNYTKHADRWAGLNNWWRSFFGIQLTGQDEPIDKSQGIPAAPRVGKKDIDVTAADFLQAWLVEGNVVAATGYVSQHASACLAREGDDPSALDRGMAPFQLMARLKAAHDVLGQKPSLEGLLAPVVLMKPELRRVKHARDSQYALYSVPDDVAARLDCESRLTLGNPTKAKREYGDYFGTIFRVTAAQGKGHTVALLWAKEGGYWKIASWQAEPDDDTRLALEAPIDVAVTRIAADPGLVAAGKAFLDAWLVRRDYDAAFGALSPKAYACYNLGRNPSQPAASSAEDAGRRLRAALEDAGNRVGKVRNLGDVVASAEPVHPALRVMDHPDSRTFALSSVPNALANAVECDARAKGTKPPREYPPEYGQGFGMNVRFLMRDGDGPVLRMLWRKEPGGWRITSYDVEIP
jgi:hypothetical protein